MPGGITLLTATNASIPTPPVGKVTVFFSTDLPGPAYKDAAGVVSALGTTGSTGATGPAGPMSIFLEDALVGEDGIPGPAGASGGGASNQEVFIVPAADESVANDTLQDDDVFFFAVEANSVYVIEGMIYWSSGAIATVDAKVAFTFPAAATLTILGEGQNAGNATIVAFPPSVRFEQTSPSTNMAWGVMASGVAAATPSRYQAVLRTGANAGTLQLQWAQNTLTGGTPLVREKDSYMRYKKVS